MFLFKNRTRASTFSGLRAALCWLATRPLAEKTRSAGVDEDGVHKMFLAKFNNLVKSNGGASTNLVGWCCDLVILLTYIEKPHLQHSLLSAQHLCLPFLHILH